MSLDGKVDDFVEELDGELVDDGVVGEGMGRARVRWGFWEEMTHVR